MRKNVLKVLGAVCGALTVTGAVICIASTELPVMPSFMAWRIVGLSMVCMGVWPMVLIAILEDDR